MEERTPLPLSAKCCYEHLGGTLGCRLFHRMVELGWFEEKDDTPRHYSITPLGIDEFIKLGVDPYERKKRK